MDGVIQNPERTLTLKMDGPGIADGKLSISTLAAKLDAAQRTLYNIALASSNRPVATRGTWSRNIKSACELVFVASKAGSLLIATELADNLVFPKMENFGSHVLSNLKQVVIALNQDDSGAIVRLLPDSAARVRALKSLENLCPREGDSYSVELGNGDGRMYGKLTYSTRATIISFFRESAEDSSWETVVLNGTLVEIRVKAGLRHIVILNRHREITCIYSDEMEGTISQLVAGSIVEVRGRAQLNSDGTIKQIDDLQDATTIDLSPFRLASFTYENRTFNLNEPVFCTVDYRNDLWVYECEQFNLHTFHTDRNAAFRQLSEEFAILYDGLHGEPDDALTLDAIELRDRIMKHAEQVTKN